MGIEKLEPSTNRLFIAHYLLRIQQNPSRRYACFVTSPKCLKKDESLFFGGVQASLARSRERYALWNEG
jgi:hypothetical protein